MNKITILAAALALIPASLSAKPTGRPDSVKVEVTMPKDSSALINANVVFFDDDTVFTAAVSAPARVVDADDGGAYILSGGKAYPLQEVADALDADGYMDDIDAAEAIADRELANLGPWGMIGILAVCFGIPSIAVILIAALIIGFLRNRNRERNAIISKAIDEGYPLPDSFFSNQGAHDGSQQPGVAATPVRDPSKFSSGCTLVAVGLCISVFFWALDVSFGFVAGGIPLLLGIGRLIGYFFVPGYASPGNQTPRGAQAQGHRGPACPPPPPHTDETFYYDHNDPRYRR